MKEKIKKKNRTGKVIFFLVIMLFSFIVMIFLYFSLTTINIDNYTCDETEDDYRCGLGKIKAKPVIYLYPEKVQNTKVVLDYNGDIFADYPIYNKSINGWEVVAYPDSKIIDSRDNKEYSYLFWEGKSKDVIDLDLSTGFVVIPFLVNRTTVT